MGPRAASRLESLGFRAVYDYVAGEADWFANGLPREGRDAAIPRAGDVAREDVPTCTLDDRIGKVQQRIRSAGWDQCVVVNDERVVLGRVLEHALDQAPEMAVERVMDEGPATIRPDAHLDAILELLQQRNARQILVTISDGRLIGALRREDAERRRGDTATTSKPSEYAD